MFLQGRTAENILAKKRVQVPWKKEGSTADSFSITFLTEPQKFLDMYRS